MKYLNVTFLTPNNLGFLLYINELQVVVDTGENIGESFCARNTTRHDTNELAIVDQWTAAVTLKQTKNEYRIISNNRNIITLSFFRNIFS